MKSRARTETTNLASVYRQETAAFAGQPSVASALPTFTEVCGLNVHMKSRKCNVFWDVIQLLSIFTARRYMLWPCVCVCLSQVGVLPTNPVSAFCIATHSFVTGELETSNLVHCPHAQVPPCRWKIFPERGVVRVRLAVLEFYFTPPVISPQRL